MTRFMVMNIDTAECDLFNTRAKAERFVAEHSNTFIIPVIDVEYQTEVQLYPNINKTSDYSFVGELKEDLYTSDLLNSIDIPVRITLDK